MGKNFDKLRKFKNLLRYLKNDLPLKLNQLSNLAEQQDCRLREQSLSLFNLQTRIDSIEASLSIMDYYNPELTMLRANPQKIQVLLVGFYGGYNFGDEMMLQVLLEILAKRKDIHVTVMLSENAVYYDAAIHGDIDIIHYCRTFSDFSHLSSYFDALIIGGGALLDDKTYRQDYRHFLNLSAVVCELPAYFMAKGKPAVCFGLSTNVSLSDTQYISSLARTINGSAYFSLRDSYSYDVLRSAGVPVDRIEVIDDLLLAHPYWIDLPPDLHKQGENTTVAITWYSEPALQGLLVDLIKCLLQENPTVKVCLVPVYEFQNADTAYYQQVVGMLPDEIANRASIESYQTTLEQAVKCFSKCSVAINIRYHAAMVCGCLGIPQVIVVWKDHPHYPNKMKWVSDAFPRSFLMDTENTVSDIAGKACIHLGDPRGKSIDPIRVKQNTVKISGTIDQCIPPKKP